MKNRLKLAGKAALVVLASKEVRPAEIVLLRAIAYAIAGALGLHFVRHP